MNGASLPQAATAVLRGESSLSEEYDDLICLARERYQAGKNGQPYEFDPPPEGLFSADVVEVMDNFLRRCWEQGREDRTEVKGTDGCST